MMIFILLFLVACFLAFSNGANDNVKGVATLFGSNTTDYKRAITWATSTTMLGSIAAVFLAGTLAANFSGKGLVADGLLQTPAFGVSIALATALTVFLATRIGMPISTTHGLLGALLGVGIMTEGSAFNLSRLATVFLVPLLIGPLVAGLLSLASYVFFRRLRLMLGIEKETCLCIGNEAAIVPDVAVAGAAAQRAGVRPSLKVAPQQECAEHYQGTFLGINAQNLIDAAHFLSAGVVSFARGLNDTPKIVGLLLVIGGLNIRWGFVAIAVSMACGGLIAARRVGETVSKNITPMNHGQGFTAYLVTGLLVATASLHGLPMSTTHVSVGSIFGIGSVTGKANPKVIRNILFSWILTVPLAAFLSALLYAFLKDI